MKLLLDTHTLLWFIAGNTNLSAFARSLIEDVSNEKFVSIACEGMPVLFRMRDNTPVAFIEQDFTNSGKVNPIKEVIIGPKNHVLPTAISVFLETIGIGSVKVTKSKASYR